MPIEWKINVDLAGRSEALSARLSEIVQESAAEIALELRRKIEAGNPSGRIYTHGPEPLPHQASAPGQPPANWTGALAESIHHEATGPMSAEVRVESPYGVYLEYGAVGRHIDPRPFFTPTLEKAAPELEAKIATAMKEIL